MIPEKVILYTSATSRKPCLLDNEFGRFRYSHIKPTGFSGYQTLEMGGEKVLIATPEKALIDFWHLESGEWTLERMDSQRFQNVELVSIKKLAGFAESFRSPRLLRAVKKWKSFVEDAAQGEKTL